MPTPVLYSFRRCPYAMRARMAIRYSRLRVELREIDFKNKPAAMLKASPKATVPVLIDSDQSVIDESLDIMRWALQRHDPDDWQQAAHREDIDRLIDENDSDFKTHLDHYKYAVRFPEHSEQHYRQQSEVFLQQLEQRLNQQRFLLSDTVSLADVALFPFIRQFAHVDIQWFDTAPYPQLRRWLYDWLESELFLSIMKKHPTWHEQQTPIIL